MPQPKQPPKAKRSAAPASSEEDAPRGAERDAQAPPPGRGETKARGDGGRDLLGEWRGVVESVFASAASAAGRADIPNELLGAMQRQVELVQEVVDRERRVQSDLAGRLLGPIDAVFDLLAESGATIRAQAEALESAGRALEESAGMMKRQAETFERAIATLRQPVELAKGGGSRRRPRREQPADAPEESTRD